MTRPRVVLAEDHHTIAEQLRALLERRCDVVATVPDGQALLTAFHTLNPQVVVTDIAMPTLSGLAAARQLLSQQPQARIVFVTVRDEPSVIKAALDLGVLGYVLKCDAGEELMTAVLAASQGEAYVSTNARSVLDRRTHDPR